MRDTGIAKLGARVVPGWFAQTHEHGKFTGRTLAEVLWADHARDWGRAINVLRRDEPTDNLDVASAEALEDAIDSFDGTVISVTHDRWFARSFERFLVFGFDAAVRESREPVWASVRAAR